MLYKSFIFLVLIFCTTESPLLAQWQKLATLSGTPSIVKFFNPDFGLLGNGGSPGGPVGRTLAIFRTTDGGFNWSNSIIPHNGPGEVTDFLMIDSLNGWASIINYPETGSGLWRTTDGGISWKATTLTADGTSVFLTPRALIVTDIFTNNHISLDSGRTWLSRSDGGKNDVAFISPLVGISTAYRGGKWRVTIDGGITWNVLSQTIESWSLYADTTSGTFFAAPEGPTNLPIALQTEVLVSYDVGATWQTIIQLPFTSTGHIGGVRDKILFVQKCSNVPGAVETGFYMTTDKGLSWSDIGGPQTFNDTRFAVLPFCRGNEGYVYAFDQNTPASLYRYHFHTGDFPLQPEIKLSSTSAKATSCDSGSLSALLLYKYCDPLIVTDAFITTGDSSNFDLYQQSLPVVLSNGQKINFSVGFDPKKNPGSYSSKIRIKGFIVLETGDTLRIDTLIPITGVSTAVGPKLLAIPPVIVLDTLSTCNPPVDSAVTLINKGCDTLIITQGPGVLPPEFQILSSLTLPIILPPDSMIVIRFRFTPDGNGKFVAAPEFTATQQGITQKLSLEWEGWGKREGGVLFYSPQQFDFGSLSICSTDSAFGFVTNTGCDSILLDPMTIVTDPDFHLTGANPKPLTLEPQDTLHYGIYLFPSQKGVRQGYVVLVSHNYLGTRLDTIRFIVLVTAGTRILSCSMNTADFGFVPVCDIRDTILILQNTGCDTVIINDYDLTGSGFATDTKFPIVILPGKEDTIHIFTLLDTAGRNITTQGLLTFTAIADNTLLPISLRRGFIYPVHRDIGIYLNGQARSGKDQDIVQYEIKEMPPGAFSGSEIKRITFDLIYNTDLLEYTISQSSGISSADGKSFMIADTGGIHADKNGVLATIGFKIYLTIDSTTRIDLRNVIIDTSGFPLLPCSTLSLSDSGSAVFNYIYQCGESSISGFMNGVLPMRIVTLHPNPAQDELVIDLQSVQKQETKIEIFDALGVKVFSDVRNIISGSNSIHLDTKALSGGMYIVRVGGASMSFVKVR